MIKLVRFDEDSIKEETSLGKEYVKESTANNSITRLLRNVNGNVEASIM